MNSLETDDWAGFARTAMLADSPKMSQTPPNGTEGPDLPDLIHIADFNDLPQPSALSAFSRAELHQYLGGIYIGGLRGDDVEAGRRAGLEERSYLLALETIVRRQLDEKELRFQQVSRRLTEIRDEIHAHLQETMDKTGIPQLQAGIARRKELRRELEDITEIFDNSAWLREIKTRFKLWMLRNLVPAEEKMGIQVEDASGHYEFARGSEGFLLSREAADLEQDISYANLIIAAARKRLALIRNFIK